jgi:hypothetical protein
MLHCPNCGANVDRTSIECEACGALFTGEGWSPANVPAARTSVSTTYLVGRAIVCLGHLMLIGVPLTTLILLLVSSGGSMSGVPSMFAIMLSPFLYAVGYLLCFIGRRRNA